MTQGRRRFLRAREGDGGGDDQDAVRVQEIRLPFSGKRERDDSAPFPKRMLTLASRIAIGVALVIILAFFSWLMIDTLTYR